jgi:hypothetical protein
MIEAQRGRTRHNHPKKLTTPHTAHGTACIQPRSKRLVGQGGPLHRCACAGAPPWLRQRLASSGKARLSSPPALAPGVAPAHAFGSCLAGAARLRSVGRGTSAVASIAACSQPRAAGPRPFSPPVGSRPYGPSGSRLRLGAVAPAANRRGEAPHFVQPHPQRSAAFTRSRQSQPAARRGCMQPSQKHKTQDINADAHPAPLRVRGAAAGGHRRAG